MKKTVLARNITIISVALALVLASILIYFVWVKPATEKNKGPEKLYDGEYYDKSSDSLVAFNEHGRDEIKTIEIKNKNDHYYLDAFLEEGYSRYEVEPNILYIPNQAFEDIINDENHTLNRTNDSGSYVVMNNVNEDYLSTYGLEKNKAKELIYKDSNGKSYTFYMGDSREISSGLAYYLYYGKNADETYCVYNIYAVTSSTNFVLRGYEKIDLEYTSVSSVVVGAGIVNVLPPTKTTYRVTDMATNEDLKMYGLDKDSDPSYVKVTLHSGEEYKFYIGRSLASSGGYYILADGRKNVVDGVEYDIVYILNSQTANTLLADSASVVSTLVCDYLGNDVSLITDIRLYRKHNDDYSLIIRAGVADETTKTAANTSFIMLYPNAYILDETGFYNNVLQYLSYIYADEVLSYGDRLLDSEVYTKYFLDCDKERLENGTDGNYAKVMYSMEPRNSEGVCEDDTYTTIYFSEKQVNERSEEFYYIYSPQKQVIAKLTASAFGFVEMNLAEFTNGKLYFNYINSTDYFELVSTRYGTNVRYTISGNERTFKAKATESGDDGKLLKRIDKETGNEVDANFDLKYTIQRLGNYIDISYSGAFEDFRSLFYVLITRPITTEVNPEDYLVSDETAIKLTIQSTKKDQSISYYKYTATGQRVLDDEGKNVQVRYLGGNIICSNVIVNTTIGGKEMTQKYDVAYYDERTGRFFIKIVDSIDGYEKPANYKYDNENTLLVSTYLPEGTTGEYTAVVYEYDIRDIYTISVDAEGKEIKRINQTYKMIIPTVIENTYKINGDGSRTLIESRSSEAQQGVLIRTQVIEKLLSDSDNLLNGIEINRDSSN